MSITIQNNISEPDQPYTLQVLQTTVFYLKYMDVDMTKKYSNWNLEQTQRSCSRQCYLFSCVYWRLFFLTDSNSARHFSIFTPQQTRFEEMYRESTGGVAKTWYTLSTSSIDVSDIFFILCGSLLTELCAFWHTRTHTITHKQTSTHTYTQTNTHTHSGDI